MSNNIISLGNVISSSDNDIYEKKFNEAEKLAKSIFKKDSPYIPLPYFTEYDTRHCKVIEEYLNLIIWGEGKPGQYDFEPTAEEAMYLLSATWLHDIGMRYGIFGNEDPNDLQDFNKVEQLRDVHELRTVRYIHEVWKTECTWENDEKTWLTNICAFHRCRHPINTFEPIKIMSKYDRKPVRLMILAALLRLADACYEGQSRAPGSLRALYISLGMPQAAVNHWERAHLIKEVEFDHKSKKIMLTGHCPPEFNFGLGEFDLKEIVEIVRQDVEKELRSIQQILIQYPNIYFGEVNHRIYHPFHLKVQEKKQYLALWPYLLGKPTGSTEAASALAEMLIFAVKEGELNHDLGKGWRSNVRSIIEEMQKSWHFDFGIRNLCREVEDIFSRLPSNAKSADYLTKYLEDFLNQMNKNCQKMAELAQSEDLINPEDVLVVHGYCINIAKFLKNLGERYESRNVLYIVDCSEPRGKIQLGPTQNDKMIALGNKLGFSEVRFLYMDALAQVLDDLKRNKIPCKILLDTHGIVRYEKIIKGFICKVGSYIIANAARELDADVIVFAENTKFLTDGESDKGVTAPEKLFSSRDMCRPHPNAVNTMCLVPEIDFVPDKFVDIVINEKGVFKSKALEMFSVVETPSESFSKFAVSGYAKKYEVLPEESSAVGTKDFDETPNAREEALAGRQRSLIGDGNIASGGLDKSLMKRARDTIDNLNVGDVVDATISLESFRGIVLQLWSNAKIATQLHQEILAIIESAIISIESPTANQLSVFQEALADLERDVLTQAHVDAIRTRFISEGFSPLALLSDLEGDDGSK